MAKQERTVRIEIIENPISMDEALANIAKVIAREMYHQEQQQKGDTVDGENG